MKQKLLAEVFQAVENINEDIHEALDNKANQIDLLGIISEGSMFIVVTYLDHQLWDNDNDEREFIEDRNDYEPLEPFLRKEIKKLIKQLNTIKF